VSVSGDFAYGYLNDVLTSVTVCIPGTTTCQTIPDLLVDTGSSGLRLIASQVQLVLPAVTSGGTPLGECLEFVDSYVWGPVVSADVAIADEQATAVPIQLLGSPAFAGPPALCSSSGLPENDTVESLGANGILGIGLFTSDCGTVCTSQGPQEPPAIYFRCPSPSAPCTPTAVPVASRFQIEFLFRDSKQFTGLLDRQARAESALDFYFNASLATLNVVRAEDLGMPQGQEPHVFSMTSWKQCHFNERLLDVFMEKFALDPTWVKKQACYDELRTYGAIAA
jgi:hypothetical protein